MKETSRAVFFMLALCILGGAIVFTLALVSPPLPLPADAPSTDFSAGRAMQELEVIAREPHPKAGLPSFPGLSTQPGPGTMRSPGELYQGDATDFTALYRLFEIPEFGGG